MQTLSSFRALKILEALNKATASLARGHATAAVFEIDLARALLLSCVVADVQVEPIPAPVAAEAV